MFFYDVKVFCWTELDEFIAFLVDYPHIAVVEVHLVILVNGTHVVGFEDIRFALDQIHVVNILENDIVEES